MNEEVTKSIANTLDNFQWIFGGLAVLLILYFIFTQQKRK